MKYFTLWLFYLVSNFRPVRNCACAPKKQFYSFSSVDMADVYCRIKYSYQYLGKNALAKLKISPEDYNTVYQDYPDQITVAENCKKTVQGESFSLAWYCAEYCIRFCPQAYSVNCTYEQAATTCRTSMHCKCVTYAGQTCDHEIQPKMLQENFNKTCLNCYWKDQGDESRNCMTSFEEVLQDSNKCMVKPVNPEHAQRDPVTIAIKTDAPD